MDDRDTTGCLLTWTMRLLVKHRNTMVKLREEIKRTVGVGGDARSPERNDMKTMVYLSYVLKEGKLPIYSFSYLANRIKHCSSSPLPFRASLPLPASSLMNEDCCLQDPPCHGKPKPKEVASSSLPTSSFSYFYHSDLSSSATSRTTIRWLLRYHTWYFQYADWPRRHANPNSRTCLPLIW
jgi:hypothetical protein